jgi:hypothetical protein
MLCMWPLRLRLRHDCGRAPYTSGACRVGAVSASEQELRNAALPRLKERLGSRGDPHDHRRGFPDQWQPVGVAEAKGSTATRRRMNEGLLEPLGRLKTDRPLSTNVCFRTPRNRLTAPSSLCVTILDLTHGSAEPPRFTREILESLDHARRDRHRQTK